jgi:methylenetetrahydrofolate reductase (NADPH)
MQMGFLPRRGDGIEAQTFESDCAASRGANGFGADLADAPHFLDGHSLEITARERHDLARVAHFLDPGSTVAIAFLPVETTDDRIEAAKVVRQLGFEPMPHLSARRLKSVEELEFSVQRLTGESGVRKVFLIAGDPSTPAGPFEDTMSMLKTGIFENHGVTAVGIAGHPEGHPAIDEVGLWRAMTDKVEEIRERGMAPALVTQFSFDADAVLTWLQTMRRQGFDIPVRLGIPGPANVKRLLRYASMCGVGSTTSVLKKYGISLARLTSPAGPDRMVDRLRSGMGESLGDVRAHMYPFGGLLPAIEWTKAYRNRSQ